MYRRPDATDWMFARASELLDRAERMHRQFFRLAPSTRAQPVWEPPVDVYERDGEVVVVVALPGVAADRVQVSYDAGTVRVRAERSLPFASSTHAVRQLEIPYGVFERDVPVPGTFAIDPPELTHGCLVVRLRRNA
jgi:HSP20 family molecular chaperone IbpA